MRLLRLEPDGTFSLNEYLGKDIPPYAILSHTWGADGEEVTYKDLMEGNAELRGGYNKLSFCADKAVVDGLDYFWVDTCCIDKTSSAELTEAINSMSRWYRDARICYVFLADVWSSRNGSANQHWKSDFQKSRWFTRGWTLQELLCPITVEFFSADWNILGNKGSLSQQINLATGIPTEIFWKKRSFLSYSVDDRMSWARKRQTKREEDAAYCLFGIFDIQLPVLYGEGKKKVLIRLRKAIHESMGNPPPPPPPPPPPHPPFFQHQLPPPPPPPLQKLSDMRSYIETQSSFRVPSSKL